MTTVEAVRLAQRVWLSRWSGDGRLRLVTHLLGAPVDADDAVTVTSTRKALEPDDSDTVVFADREAVGAGTGTYEVVPTSDDTAEPGVHEMVWSYDMDGTPRSYTTYYEVGEASPVYDALPVAAKAVVENVWDMLSDSYDSPLGGPYLQVNVQGGFGRDRMAGLLRTALGKVNVAGQPTSDYGLGDDDRREFPWGPWGGLVEMALLRETLLHLRRSYVERPLVSGVTTGRMDRRDYYARWGEILSDTDEEWRSMLDTWKIRHMGLGRPKVAVAGGLYLRRHLWHPAMRGELAVKGLWQAYH